MTQQTKRPNLLPYLLVLLVLVGVYGFMNKPVEAEPSYAEVRELFESEQVSAFTVTDTTLRMKLREPIDGKTELKKDLFSVTLFYDDLGELIEQQKADGIIEDYDFTADHSINYVAMFAPYILAVLGIFAIWYFLSVRSAGGGGGDRMAKFGTASFKTGGDNKRPTTFSDVAGADEEKEELQEIVDFLKAPGSSSTSARASPRACCSSALRARARRCWPAPWQARRMCSSFPFPVRILWSCMSAWREPRSRPV